MLGGSGVDHLAATNIVNHGGQSLTRLAAVDADIMVVDYAVLIEGDLIGKEANGAAYGTTASQNASRINFVVNRFSGVYEDAPVYTPEATAR